MVLHIDSHNVNLFKGKDWEFRAKIILYLSITEHASTWDVTENVSQEEIKKEPSKKSLIIKRHHAGVFKNIKRMVKEGYVKEVGTRTSKGNIVSLYGLTFKGSLAVFDLTVNNNDVKKIINNCRTVNPFFNLILKLHEEGIEWKLLDSIFLIGIITAVKQRIVNLENNNEWIIGNSVIIGLVDHIHSLIHNELKIMKEHLSKIWHKKHENKIDDLTASFFGSILNPFYWSMWRNDENAQFITLYTLVDMVLNPEEYELPSTVKVKNETKEDKSLRDLTTEIKV